MKLRFLLILMSVLLTISVSFIGVKAVFATAQTAPGDEVDYEPGQEKDLDRPNEKMPASPSIDAPSNSFTGGAPIYISPGQSAVNIDKLTDDLLKKGKELDCQVAQNDAKAEIAKLEKLIQDTEEFINAANKDVLKQGKSLDQQISDEKAGHIAASSTVFLSEINDLKQVSQSLSAEAQDALAPAFADLEEAQAELAAMGGEDLVLNIALNKELKDFEASLTNLAKAIDSNTLTDSEKQLLSDDFYGISNELDSLVDNIKTSTAKQELNVSYLKGVVDAYEKELEKQKDKLEDAKAGVCKAGELSKKAQELAEKAKNKEPVCYNGQLLAADQSGNYQATGQGCGSGSGTQTAGGGPSSSSPGSSSPSSPPSSPPPGINAGPRVHDKFSAAEIAGALELCTKNQQNGSCVCKGSNGGKDGGKSVFGESPYFGAFTGADGQAAVANREKGVAKCEKASENKDLNFHLQASLRPLEGYHETSYNDSQGHCTIGVGALLHKGGCKSRQTWSEQQICTRFAYDAQKFLKKALHNAEDLGIDDTSMVIAIANVNYQTGGLRNFTTVWNALAKGDWNAAISALSQTKWACQTWLRVEQFQKAIYDYATKCAKGGIKPQSCAAAAGSLNTSKCSGGQRRASFHPKICT